MLDSLYHLILSAMSGKAVEVLTLLAAVCGLTISLPCGCPPVARQCQRWFNRCKTQRRNIAKQSIGSGRSIRPVGFSKEPHDAGTQPVASVMRKQPARRGF